MDYYMNTSGSDRPCIREYVIQSTRDLSRGTVMAPAKGYAAPANNSCSALLGVLAEDYKMVPDDLSPRAHNGTGRAGIIVSPGAIYRVKAFRFTVSSVGTTTSITVSGLSLPSGSDNLKNGAVKLVSHGVGSTNTDAEGVIRAISASSGSTLTVASGGAACAGDVYELYVPAGYNYLAFSTDAADVVPSSTTSSLLKAAGFDTRTGHLEIILGNCFYK